MCSCPLVSCSREANVDLSLEKEKQSRVVSSVQMTQHHLPPTPLSCFPLLPPSQGEGCLELLPIGWSYSPQSETKLLYAVSGY